MAHRGEERALGLVRHFRRGARLPRVLEEHRVLQSSPDVGGDGFEQALVVVVVNAFSLRTLYADHALALAAHENRYAEIRARGPADEAAAQFLPAFAHIRVEDQ